MNGRKGNIDRKRKEKTKIKQEREDKEEKGKDKEEQWALSNYEEINQFPRIYLVIPCSLS